MAYFIALVKKLYPMMITLETTTMLANLTKKLTDYFWSLLGRQLW